MTTLLFIIVINCGSKVIHELKLVTIQLKRFAIQLKLVAT